MILCSLYHKLKLRNRTLLLVAAALLVAELGFSLTPVARWDVVPYQRIDQGTVFNAGVVAFSKAGIDRVTFSVSGQGYSGPSPMTSTSMTYNPRTQVHEYWVPIAAHDFASDGVFTITATVRGRDGGSRALGEVSLVVNATGRLSSPEVWVSPTGSNSTGTVNDPSRPYATIGHAIGQLQAANGGRADGGYVYLKDGQYELGNANVSTTDEWLTIASSQSASRGKVVVHGGGSAAETKLLRFHGLTLRSDGSNDLFLQGWPDPKPSWLWVDTCDVVGSGRYVQNSSPVFRNDNWFLTDSYMRDSDITIRFADIVRNVDIEHIGDDALFMCDMAINVTLRDQDPGSTYDHSDGWQNGGAAMNNRIVYGYYGTDMHYQGIFIRNYPDGSAHTNNAFVNVFLEMREPARPGAPGGDPVLKNAYFGGRFDHLIVWNCTFPTATVEIIDDTGVSGFENSSFVGNVFYRYLDWVTGIDGGADPAYAAPGNPYNNDFLHNHFVRSYVDGQDPTNHYTKSPDSDPSGSQSVGDAMLDLSPPAGATFGFPQTGSPLLDRLPAIVPVDALGNIRGATSDIGALETRNKGSSPIPPADSPNTPPSGIRVEPSS